MISLEYRDQIIDYIKRNRVSSTEVADCLDKTGAIAGARPVNRGHFVVGTVNWVYCYGETNWHLHKQIEDVEDGAVVYAEAFQCGERAIFGDIVAKYLLLYQQAAGIVVSGILRDAPRLIKENWPIWCEGFSPVGCFNKNIDGDLDARIMTERQEKFHGAIAVCDDTGVTIIPKDRFNQEFLNRLVAIEEQEDIWYECIDRKKWSTFKTICLKKYLEEGSS